MALASLIFVATWILAPGFFNNYFKIRDISSLILGLTICCQWHFLLNTISELAYALNISVLKVKDKTVDLARPLDKAIINERLIEK